MNLPLGRPLRAPALLFGRLRGALGGFALKLADLVLEILDLALKLVDLVLKIPLALPGASSAVNVASSMSAAVTAGQRAAASSIRRHMGVLSPKPHRNSTRYGLGLISALLAQEIAALVALAQVHRHVLRDATRDAVTVVGAGVAARTVPVLAAAERAMQDLEGDLGPRRRTVT